jgi:hypothetical protein
LCVFADVKKLFEIEHTKALTWRGSAVVVLGAGMLSASAWFAFHALVTAHLLLRRALNAFRSRPVLPPALVLRAVRPSVWPPFYAAMPVPHADDAGTLRSLLDLRRVLDSTHPDPRAHAVFTRVLELQEVRSQSHFRQKCPRALKVAAVSAFHSRLWRHSAHRYLSQLVCLTADVLRRIAGALVGPGLDPAVFALTLFITLTLFLLAELVSIPLLCFHLYLKEE